MAANSLIATPHYSCSPVLAHHSRVNWGLTHKQKRVPVPFPRAMADPLPDPTELSWGDVDYGADVQVVSWISSHDRVVVNVEYAD